MILFEKGVIPTVNNYLKGCPGKTDGREIMQGDSYAVPFRIEQDGRPLTQEDVAAVEIVIGTLRKTGSELNFDPDSGMWEFPLSQSESLGLAASPSPAQVRVKFRDGTVIGGSAGCVYVARSLSREVI